MIVAAAIIRSGTVRGAESSSPAVPEVLIGRRTAPAALAGCWEFPGGKLEPGETPHQGVHREIREELGIEIDLGEELSPADGDGWPIGKNLRMKVFYARMREATQTPAPLEGHDLLRWAAIDSHLMDYTWIPANIPIVKKLITHKEIPH